MSDNALTDPAPAPQLGASRTRVLELLRSRDAPVSVQEVAESTGLHPNTARFHLDGLVDAGLATRDREGTGGPGRPRTIYRPTGEDTVTGARSYRLLAEMLTSMITETVEQPATAAVAAGREWGQYLVERPAPTRRVDTTDALDRLHRLLEDTGFAPDPVAESDGETVLGLRRCPFQEIAEQHRDVVCSLHLGLMQGALAEVRTPVTVDTLEPFATPARCVATLGEARRG